MNRRFFLKAAGIGAMVGMVPPLFGQTESAGARERFLSLYNIHTDESLETVYWRDGLYVPASLDAINALLRDYRANELYGMDVDVIDALHDVALLFGEKEPIHIVSGYRSPATNEMLRQNSPGVAKNSFHMQGKAIDFYLPSYDLAVVREAALAFANGGVGYYPQSGFVHIDTGELRQW